MIKPLIILKYISKENLVSLGVLFFFICFLFFSIDLVELLRRGASKDIPLKILINISLLHLPALFPIILPTTFLLSTMHTFMRLNKNNELSILKASGISFWVFVLPAVFNALMVSLLFTFLFNPVFSQMNIKFRTYESIFFKGNSGLHTISPTGLWLKEITETNEYVINSSHYSSEEKKLINVKIFEFDKNDNFLRRIDASEVEMFDDKWDLKNVSVVELNKNPNNFDLMSFKFNLSIEKIEQNFRSAETISFWKLDDYIKNLENSGFNARPHKVYLNYLLSFPLLLISMVLLGTKLSISMYRKKKVFLNIFAGLVSGVFFHFLTDVFRTVGISGKLSIFMSVWAVPTIFILILLGYLIHTEDG